MLTSERIAIAAHLHVLLRRKTGRVTDVEWMAANAAYAAEIVRFARAHAAEDNAPELTVWADKLEAAMLSPEPVRRPPLLAPRPEPLPTTEPPARVAGTGDVTDVPSGVDRYVGRLR